MSISATGLTWVFLYHLAPMEQHRSTAAIYPTTSTGTYECTGLIFSLLNTHTGHKQKPSNLQNLIFQSCQLLLSVKPLYFTALFGQLSGTLVMTFQCSHGVLRCLLSQDHFSLSERGYAICRVIIPKVFDSTPFNSFSRCTLKTGTLCIFCLCSFSAAILLLSVHHLRPQNRRREQLWFVKLSYLPWQAYELQTIALEWLPRTDSSLHLTPPRPKNSNQQLLETGVYQSALPIIQFSTVCLTSCSHSILFTKFWTLAAPLKEPFLSSLVGALTASISTVSLTLPVLIKLILLLAKMNNKPFPGNCWYWDIITDGSIFIHHGAHLFLCKCISLNASDFKRGSSSSMAKSLLIGILVPWNIDPSPGNIARR